MLYNNIVCPTAQGDWKPPQIDNPDYKGEWVHPEIPNPSYELDDTLYMFEDFGSIGFDLWQVKLMGGAPVISRIK